MALVEDVQNALQPYMTGPMGFSQATDAAMGQFMQSTAPVLQNQMQLQGLGNGPAVADVMGRSLGEALPQFIQGDLSNRLQAASQMTNLGSGVVIPSWDMQMKQQGQALQGMQSAGELQRGISQDVFDSAREEMLRQQGLSESGTTGVFGAYSPITKTESSGGK